MPLYLFCGLRLTENSWDLRQGLNDTSAQTSACVSPVLFKKRSLFSSWQTNYHDVVKASTQLWKLALTSAFSKHSHLSLIIHAGELSILVSLNQAYTHQTFYRNGQRKKKYLQHKGCLCNIKNDFQISVQKADI